MITLLLIRHGEACGDSHRLCNPPVDGFLTDLGQRQAHHAAELIRHVTIDHVFVSPLGRAIQTAQHFAHNRDNLPMRILPWLIEWRPATQTGECDESQYEMIQHRAALIRPEAAWKTPAGEGTLQMAHRVIVGFVELMQSVGVQPAHGGYLIDQSATPQTLALVAHGGTLGRLAAFLLGIPLTPYAPIALGCGSILRFDFIRRVDTWYPNLTVSLPEFHE